MVAREAALAALRSALVGHPFEHDTVVDVTDAGAEGFLLEVRGGRRRGTRLVVIPADADSLDTDHVTGDQLHGDADDWATWARLWLMGAFDTGLLRWGARRRLRDGRVAIDPTIPVEHARVPWSLSTVPLVRPTHAASRELRRRMRLRRSMRPGASSVVVIGGRFEEEPDPHPGEHLRDAGLDPAAGRRAHRDGRLVTWFQVFSDDTAAARVIGQVVAAWEDTAAGIAGIDHLEVVAGTPTGVVRDLVEAAAHACADEGAARVVTTLAVDGLDEVGFGPPDGDGRRRLETSTLP